MAHGTHRADEPCHFGPRNRRGLALLALLLLLALRRYRTRRFPHLRTDGTDTGIAAGLVVVGRCQLLTVRQVNGRDLV